MKWITIYSITEESYLLDEIILVILGLVSALYIIIEVLLIRENKFNIDVKGIVITVGCAILLFFSIFALTLDLFEFQGFSNKYKVAYEEQKYATIEGNAVPIMMSNGAFFFSVEDIHFKCDAEFNQNRKTNVDPYIEKDYLIKVYYYDNEFYDEVNRQYMVLRIDVLMDNEMSSS